MTVDRLRPLHLAKRMTGARRFDRDDEDGVSGGVRSSLKVLPISVRRDGSANGKKGKRNGTYSVVKVGLPAFPSSVSFFLSISHCVNTAPFTASITNCARVCVTV